jgi:hypothetical protein
VFCRILFSPHLAHTAVDIGMWNANVTDIDALRGELDIIIAATSEVNRSLKFSCLIRELSTPFVSLWNLKNSYV